MTVKFSKPSINLDNPDLVFKIITEEPTDYKYGKIPTERTIKELLNYGLINLDKPSGPTSHEVVSYVKRILDIPKAGHSGTLDPAVTGVLPIALQNATKMLDTLLLSGKEYICNMFLHSEMDKNIVKKIMNKYIGIIYQRPPVRASVKRVLRKREIYDLEILEIKEREVLFRIESQAGFYVRKFAHDIGQSLGCGAHMKELRRTKTGPITENNHSATLHELYDAHMWYKEENNDIPLRNVILPMEYGVKHVPKIVIKDSAVDTVCHGAPVALPAITKYNPVFEKGDLVTIHTIKNELIAIGEAQLEANAIEEKKKGLVASVKRVLMPVNTYPKYKAN